MTLAANSEAIGQQTSKLAMHSLRMCKITQELAELEGRAVTSSDNLECMDTATDGATDTQEGNFDYGSTNASDRSLNRKASLDNSNNFLFQKN